MASEHKHRACKRVLVEGARLVLGLSAAAVVLPLYVGAKVYRELTSYAKGLASAGGEGAPPAAPPATQRAPSAETVDLGPGVWPCPDEPPDDALVGGLEGAKYHRPSCRWARNIQSDNRICFADAQAAQAYGYSPCGTCKPA